MLEAADLKTATVLAAKSKIERLAIWRLVGFSLPLVTMMMLQIPLNSLLPTFYAQETEINLTTVGVVFLIARLFDMVLNPIIGALSDNTKSKFGWRRLWVLFGTPVILLAYAFVFFPPQIVTAAYILLLIPGVVSVKSGRYRSRF